MIQVHLMELFARPDIFVSKGGQVSLLLGAPPAAPVFMVMMGLFLFRTQKPMRALLLRGLGLLTGGLLLNIGLNAHLFVRIWRGDFELNPWAYVFGVDILLLAGMSVVLIALLRPIFQRFFPLALLIAFGCSCATLLIPNSVSAPYPYITAFLWGKTTWSYFPLLPWFSWSLLGYFLGAVFEKQVPLRIRVLVICSSLFVVFLLFPMGFRISADLPEYYHHGPLYFFWGSCFVLVLMGLFSLMDRLPGLTFFRWLGKNVTSAFVFQWLLIGNIATALYRTQGWGDLVAWFVGVVGAVSLFVRGWEYVRSKVFAPVSE
jgi:uncharacterized membrane protein